MRLSFAMPPRLELAGGVEKVILKHAYARHILRPRKLRQSGIFNPERVRKLLRYDSEGSQGRYGLRLWMLVTFEIWRRLVIEREPV